jgi:hypothetical protein
LRWEGAGELIHLSGQARRFEGRRGAAGGSAIGDEQRAGEGDGVGTMAAMREIERRL